MARAPYNLLKGDVALHTNRMKTLSIFALALLALASVAPARAQLLTPKLQNAIGKWQVIDSEGKPGGQVETYLENGKLFGRVTQVKPGRTDKDVCEKCSGELKNQLILGMETTGLTAPPWTPRTARSTRAKSGLWATTSSTCAASSAFPCWAGQRPG